jgi:hypothetical protein
MRSIIALCVCLTLSSCISFTRSKVDETTKENTVEKTVTKEEKTFVIDAVANVPNVGPVTVLGRFTETTLRETLTESEANKERLMIASNPIADKMVATIGAAGKHIMTGNWTGAVGEFAMLIMTALTTGYAGKKMGESNEKTKRIERAESNEDETYNDAKSKGLYGNPTEST